MALERALRWAQSLRISNISPLLAPCGEMLDRTCGYQFSELTRGAHDGRFCCGAQQSTGRPRALDHDEMSSSDAGQLFDCAEPNI